MYCIRNFSKLVSTILQNRVHARFYNKWLFITEPTLGIFKLVNTIVYADESKWYYIISWFIFKKNPTKYCILIGYPAGDIRLHPWLKLDKNVGCWLITYLCVQNLWTRLVVMLCHKDGIKLKEFQSVLHATQKR